MPFAIADRELLLAVKGVGPTVIARLEQLGYSDLKELAGADVRQIVEGAAALVGSTCWKNSPQARAAIQAAITAAAGARKTKRRASPSGKSAPSPQAILELADMANLGPKSAAVLAAAGVKSAEHLAALGSVAAFSMAKRSDARVSLNLLWAIEAALCGESWQTVAREHRTSLLLALDAHENDRSKMPGTTTLAAEVTHVSKHGFWLLLADEELLVPFDQFPWFQKGTIEQISDVQWPTPDHLYWPRLDVDLSVQSIRNPSAFPLVSGATG